MELLLPVARWTGYVGVLVAVGAGVFQLMVRWRAASDFPMAVPLLLRRTRAALLVAALFLFVSLVARLATQLQSMLEPGDPLTRELLSLVVLKTSWGASWRLQAGAAVLVLVSTMAAKSGWAPLMAGLAAAGAGSLTGHAAEHPWGRAAGVLLHGLHQAGAGAWLGTLALVVVAGYGATRSLPPEERHQLIARLVRAYSPVALAGVATAVGAGLVLSLVYIEPLSALFTTAYGRTLLLKVVLLGGTAGLGAYNWRRVRPRLGDGVASARLFRSASAELVLGALVLGATALLVGLGAPALGE